MNINPAKLRNLVALLVQHCLLSQEEALLVNLMASHDFPFTQQLAIADTIHCHVHTPALSQLPHTLFLAQDAEVETRAEGYIKYTFPEGMNLIFSQVTIARDAPEGGETDKAYLDHIGIDVRSDTKEAYMIFQKIPYIASQQDYLFTRQGGGVESVQCCHSQVREKYWVYPDKALNYEFSFGPLIKQEGIFGIDVRPANPYRVQPRKKATACCSGSMPAAGIFVTHPTKP